MPILNYTTTVSAGKTAAEVQQMLAKGGAQSVAIEYDSDALPMSLSFTITLFDRPMRFQVPCNAQGVYAAMCKPNSGVPRSSQTLAQARRVAWRIIKDWTEAQLAIVESQQAQMSEVFLPYLLDDKNQTMFQRFAESTQKQLTEGES